MLETLLAFIVAGLVAIALIQRSHMRWVRREFRKNTLAHGRIVKQLPVGTPSPFLLIPPGFQRTRVWPQRKPAPEPEDWSDDCTGTESFRVSD